MIKIMTKQDYLVEYDGIIFTPEELEILSSDSRRRYQKLITKNRDFQSMPVNKIFIRKEPIYIKDYLQKLCWN